MIIDCISDLHGAQPHLEGGDLLIIAGDLTARDTYDEYLEFQRWANKLDYSEIIIIAGNHEGLIQNTDIVYDFLYEFTYLQDSGTKFDGLKIWGSPWTLPFCDWHFMLPPDEIKKKWDLIPDDTDILVTHGPPFYVLDSIHVHEFDLQRMQKCESTKYLGCRHLREALDRVKPKLHVFGHIHGGYGQCLYKHQGPNTICVNAAIMNERYEPVNKPIRVIL